MAEFDARDHALRRSSREGPCVSEIHRGTRRSGDRCDFNRPGTNGNDSPARVQAQSFDFLIAIRAREASLRTCAGTSPGPTGARAARATSAKQPGGSPALTRTGSAAIWKRKSAGCGATGRLRHRVPPCYGLTRRFSFSWAAAASGPPFAPWKGRSRSPVLWSGLRAFPDGCGPSLPSRIRLLVLWAPCLRARLPGLVPTSFFPAYLHSFRGVGLNEILDARSKFGIGDAVQRFLCHFQTQLKLRGHGSD